MTPDGRCRTCGALIIWARTLSGKSMPVDAEPASGGTLVLTAPSDPREPPNARHFTHNPALPRYTSHFATCPDASAHRKPR